MSGSNNITRQLRRAQQHPRQQQQSVKQATMMTLRSHTQKLKLTTSSAPRAAHVAKMRMKKKTNAQVVSNSSAEHAVPVAAAPETATAETKPSNGVVIAKNKANMVFLCPNGVAYKTSRFHSRDPGLAITMLNRCLLHETYMNFVTFERVFPTSGSSSLSAVPTVLAPAYSLGFRDAFFMAHNSEEPDGGGGGGLEQQQLFFGMERGQQDMFQWLQQAQQKQQASTELSPPPATTSLWREMYQHVVHVALALYHLHDKLGVTHCDVKPENVILNVNGEARLSDMDGASFGTRVPSVNTTLWYMAPEEEEHPDAAKLIKLPHPRAPSFDSWSLSMLIQACIRGDDDRDKPLSLGEFVNACRSVYGMPDEEIRRLWFVYCGLHCRDPAQRMTLRQTCEVLLHGTSSSRSDQLSLPPTAVELVRPLKVVDMMGGRRIAGLGRRVRRSDWAEEQEAEKAARVYRRRDSDLWPQSLKSFMALVERQILVFSLQTACVALNIYIEALLSVSCHPSTNQHTHGILLALASLDIAARICNAPGLSLPTWRRILNTELLVFAPPPSNQHEAILLQIRRLQHTVVRRWLWGDVRREASCAPSVQWDELKTSLLLGGLPCQAHDTYAPRRVAWRPLLTGWLSSSFSVQVTTGGISVSSYVVG